MRKYSTSGRAITEFNHGRVPCEKHGPWASITTNTAAFGLGFCLLNPSGHVFHAAIWHTHTAHSVESVSKMKLILSVTFPIFFAKCVVLWVQLALLSLGGREDISITRLIIIIKWEGLTFPVAVILFQGCVSGVVVPLYASVSHTHTHIYIYICISRESRGFASLFIVQSYDVRK